MANPEVLGPASLAITQSVGLFQGFLPRFTEIRRASPDDPGMERDVHMGMFAAATLGIGIGATVSSLTGSSIPVFISLLTIVGLMMLYETALKSPGEGISVA